MPVKWKQVEVPTLSTTTAVTDGQTAAGTEAAEIIAGLANNGTYQHVAVETDGRVQVSDGGGSLSVDVAALPLPSGAATSAKQDTGNTSLGNLDTKTPALVSGRVPVDGSGVTQPVSGTVTAAISGTPSVSVTSSVLPTGAALDATLTGGTQKAINRGGAKGSTAAADVTSTASGANHQALDVVIYDTAGNAITSFTGGSVSVSNFPATQAVSAAALPLPTGASTSALQTTGNTSLGNIDTKTPALVSGRVPVDGSGVTQPVSGTVTAAISGTPNVTVTSSVLPTGAAQDSTLTGGTARTQLTNGTTNVAVKAASAAPVASDPALVVAVSPNTVINAPLTLTGVISSSTNTSSLTLSGRKSVGVIFNTSAFVSGLIPQASIDGTYWTSCYWIDVNPSSGNYGVPVASESFNIASGIVVSRAVVLPAGAQMFRLTTAGLFTSGSVTYTVTATNNPLPDFSFVSGFQKTTVSGTLTANLGTIGSAATESTLSSVNTKLPASLGQKTMTASLPVTLASNQSALSVTGDVNITNSQIVVEPRALSTTAVTSVAASASSVQLLAANTGRRRFSVYNDSTATLRLKLGTTASTTSYTVKLVPDAYYESVIGDYTGRIDGIWESATGSARITEVTL